MSQQDLFEISCDTGSDFRAYLPEYQIILKQLTTAYPCWKKFDNVFDGGCGFGASTLAIGRTLPNSQIWAVSVGQEPPIAVRKELGERLHFQAKTIVEFLRQTDKLFDLVFFIRVPLTSIDYKLLFSHVQKGGCVVILGDNRIDEKMMSGVGFRKTEFPIETLAASYPNQGLWIK